MRMVMGKWLGGPLRARRPVGAILISLGVLAMEPVTDIRQLALSDGFGCGASESGALRCFGANHHGELGQGQPRADEDYIRFARQTIAAGVTALAVGRGHVCAIVSAALWCWGANNAGQVGGGRVGGRVGVDVQTPLQIITGGVTAVAAGGDNTCAVVSGALRCWGRNDEGQVGNGIPASAVGSPLEVIAAGVTAVATGGQHTCAVVNGALECWGFLLQSSGRGFATVLAPEIVIAQGVTAVAAAMHTCAIVCGALVCWVRNFHGQVGVAEGPRLAPGAPTEIIPHGVT